jgi:mutator protein MutT
MSPGNRAADGEAPGAASALRWVDVALVVLWRRAKAGDAVEVLVARRHAEAVRGGLWEYPGGKIDPGEAPAAAALRELLEETGLGDAALAGAPEPIGTFSDFDPAARAEKAVRLHAFLVKASSAAAPVPRGAAEVAWVAPARLAELPFPAGNAAINAFVRERFDEHLPALAAASRTP